MANTAQRAYLAQQLDGIEQSDFDGQGGFWAKAAQLGIPEHQINSLIAGFTRMADPNTGAPQPGYTESDLGYAYTAPADTSPTAAPAMAANPGQSERNWGANPDKARWIAQQTGYGGDFGNGSFNQWSQQNGINGTQLEQQWAQQQGQRYALPQTMGFGGQQTMGFGQNNWASMPGMQGLLNGFGNQPTPDIGWANTGSSMMAGPSSSNGWQGPSDGGWKSNGTGPNMDGGAGNTGRNMLWSW